MNNRFRLHLLRICFFVLLAVCRFSGYAQSVRDIFIEASDNGKPVSLLLTEIEQKHGVDFICDEQKMLALTVYGVTLKQRITDYFHSNLPAYKIIKINEKIFMIVGRQEADLNGWVRENYIILKQRNDARITLKGTVLVGKTDEPLSGAQMYFSESKK